MMKSAKNLKFLISIYLSFWIFFTVYFVLKYFIFSYLQSDSELFYNHNHFNFKQGFFILLAPIIILISVYLSTFFKKLDIKFLKNLSLIISFNLLLNSLSYILLGLTDIILLIANLLATSFFIIYYEFGINEKNEIIKPNSTLIIIESLLITSTYAFIQYQVFGDFKPTNMALFIINKTLIFSAITLIPFMINSKEKALKFSINSLVFLHIAISLYLLNPGFYPEIFENNNMLNTMGILLVGFGLIAALFFFNSVAKMFIEIAPALNSSLLFIFVIAHNASIGWNIWLNYTQWNGGMPPITMITAFILCYSLVLTVVRFFRKRADKRF